MTTGLLIALLAAMIVLSAFFSSSETGMMTLNRYRLRHLKNSGHRGARRASLLLKRPDRLIGIILIGNNLVNIFASAIATVIALRLWGNAGIAVATLGLTLIILIFAELTPKTIAALYPERIAFPASLVLLPLLKISYPLVWLVNTIVNGLLRLCGIRTAAGDEDHLSLEELRTLVGEAGKRIPKRHRGMLLNLLDLEQATVEDLMIPRGDIIGIDLNDDDDHILHVLRTTEHTRIPVYQDNINNVVGILHQRHVSRAIGCDGRLDREALLREVGEAYFVPESTRLHTQLFNFQHSQRRMALTVDEYGVVQGMVTLEDILEEIVGDFTSHFGAHAPEIVSVENGEYLIEGSTSIRDINRQLEWDLPTDGPKTLNGLLMETLESFPDAPVSVRIDDYVFEVLSIEGNLIQRVRSWEWPGS